MGGKPKQIKQPNPLNQPKREQQDLRERAEPAPQDQTQQVQLKSKIPVLIVLTIQGARSSPVQAESKIPMTKIKSSCLK